MKQLACTGGKHGISGLRDKKASSQAAVDYLGPYAILGCETKLNNSVFSLEVLPPQYLTNSWRKGRTSSGGGVILVIKESYVTNEVQTHSTAEEIWAEVELPKASLVHWPGVSVNQIIQDLE